MELDKVIQLITENYDVFLKFVTPELQKQSFIIGSPFYAAQGHIRAAQKDETLHAFLAFIAGDPKRVAMVAELLNKSLVDSAPSYKAPSLYEAPPPYKVPASSGPPPKYEKSVEVVDEAVYKAVCQKVADYHFTSFAISVLPELRTYAKYNNYVLFEKQALEKLPSFEGLVSFLNYIHNTERLKILVSLFADAGINITW